MPTSALDLPRSVGRGALLASLTPRQVCVRVGRRLSPALPPGAQDLSGTYRDVLCASVRDVQATLLRLQGLGGLFVVVLAFPALVPFLGHVPPERSGVLFASVLALVLLLLGSVLVSMREWDRFPSTEFYLPTALRLLVLRRGGWRALPASSALDALAWRSGAGRSLLRGLSGVERELALGLLEGFTGSLGELRATARLLAA